MIGVSRIELVQNVIRDFKVGEDVQCVLIVVKLIVEFENLSGHHGVRDDAGAL